MAEPIRVLHVVTHMNRGGLETMIMNYYRYIDRTKIQFDFLTHRQYIGDYGKEIEQLGGKIYHLPVLNPFSIRYRNALNNFFNNHQEYKIVHVHQDCLSSLILKVAKHCGVPVRIAHSHNANQDRNWKYIVKLFYKKYIPKYSTQLMACGKEAGEWMFGNYEFDILNNAIDAKKYIYTLSEREKQRNKLKINDKELLIGHVGRFCPQKNHKFLIEIFYKIQEKVPSKLLLIGDGELRKEVEIQVKNKGIENKVIFLGVRKDVNLLLQAMDVFLFPSQYEGLGIVAVEAQAAGLPCIISEGVPLECKLTDSVEQIKLVEPVEIWAEKTILVAKEHRRDSTYNIICEKGYDIMGNANILMNYYIKCLKEKKLWN